MTAAARLNDRTLKEVGGPVSLPQFDRRNTGIGQVHLGVGAFFKAHLAQYTQAAIDRAGGDWGVIGASLRSPQARDELAPQDNLFSVAEKDGAGSKLTVNGVFKSMLVAPENPEALIAAIADPDVKIVTATITEKGYCLDPATSTLDFDHPDIKHDIENRKSPKSAIGILSAAIARRIDARAPVTMISCDNLSNNGVRLKNAIRDFLLEADRENATVIDEFVRFPSTMVDRITPATTDDDRDDVARHIGLRDEAAVVTEPFTQWVIEDDFAGDRPKWEEAGALLVSDVAPFELAKLRLLNGAHSTLAYLGYLAGCEFVSDAMANRDLARFIRDMQRVEIAPTVTAPREMPLAPYIDALEMRFRNPALKHRTWQIAMDGSQKLPQRLVDTVRAQLERNGPINRLTLAVAAWTQYVSGVDENGRAIDVRDPLSAQLKAVSDEAGVDPDTRARAFLRQHAVFGDDIIKSERFCGALASAIGHLRNHGAASAVKRANEEEAQ